MSASLEVAIARLAPLLVADAEFSDPTLILGGDNWSLAATCPWRVVKEDEVWFAWTDADAVDRVWDLIGLRVTAVRQRGRDPVVHLSDGSRIEIVSDTDVDPWVLRLADRTFVGPLEVV